MEHSTTRRSFLKGLAGSIVAGSFVITNPKVVSGDLLIPDPEPTLLQVTGPILQTCNNGGALVRRVNFSMNYLAHTTMEVELLLGPDTRQDVYDIRPNDEIYFVVVKESSMRARK